MRCAACRIHALHPSAVPRPACLPSMHACSASSSLRCVPHLLALPTDCCRRRRRRCWWMRCWRRTPCSCWCTGCRLSTRRWVDCVVRAAWARATRACICAYVRACATAHTHAHSRYASTVAVPGIFSDEASAVCSILASASLNCLPLSCPCPRQASSEEASAVYNILAIIENMIDLKPSVAEDVVEQTKVGPSLSVAPPLPVRPARCTRGRCTQDGGLQRKSRLVRRRRWRGRRGAPWAARWLRMQQAGAGRLPLRASRLLHLPLIRFLPVCRSS